MPGSFDTDFRNGESAADKINLWVAENTEQRIPTIVSPDQLSPETALLLVNAVYFKMPWQDPFEPNDTNEAPFFVNGDERANVPTMRTEESFRYASVGKDCQVVELPYIGGQLAMVILLPCRGPFSQFTSQLNIDGLGSILSSLEHRTVRLALPRFKFDRSLELKDALNSLGVSEPFDPRMADFGELLMPSQIESCRFGWQRCSTRRSLQLTKWGPRRPQRRPSIA